MLVIRSPVMPTPMCPVGAEEGVGGGVDSELEAGDSGVGGVVYVGGMPLIDMLPTMAFHYTKESYAMASAGVALLVPLTAKPPTKFF